MKKLIFSLIASLRFYYLMHMLARIDAEQRRAVSDMLFSADYRLYAQREFAERSQANEARKRALLKQLDELQGEAS